MDNFEKKKKIGYIGKILRKMSIFFMTQTQLLGYNLGVSSVFFVPICLNKIIERLPRVF